MNKSAGAVVVLVPDNHRPVAALVSEPLSPEQRDRVYALLPGDAVMNLELARRWRRWAVMCPREWAVEQLKRVPMLPPKGESLVLEAGRGWAL